MELNKQIPIIRCGALRLTVSEAEAALDHAAAFIDLAESLDAKRFGVAAQEWRAKYRDEKPKTTDCRF